MKRNTTDCVVSLTTWRKRIGSPVVRENIYRLLRQKTVYNYRVVLVLSYDEFPKREKEVPKDILAMVKEPRFDILWCKENTKALKKLSAPMRAFPDLPIITTDDDIAVKDWFVDAFMKAHKDHPKDIITAHLWTHSTGIKMSGWARLFPVNSLARLPDSLFMKYFNGLEDDYWNGLRAYIVGTKYRNLGSWPFDKEVEIGNALRERYSKTDPVEMLRKFAKEWKGSI